MQLPFKLRNAKQLVGLIMLGALCALPAKAQSVITFTMSGVFRQTSLGYNHYAAITLTFTTTDTFSFTSNSEFTDTSNVWLTSEPGDPEIWSDISSTSFLGTYSAPDESSGQLAVADGGLFPTQAQGPFGLRTADNTQINSIEIEIPELTDFIYGSTFVQPVAYFQDYLATYSGLSDAAGTIYTSAGNTSFTVDTLTIASAPLSTVPEPGTTAALAGATALAFVFLRRRRRHQAKA